MEIIILKLYNIQLFIQGTFTYILIINNNNIKKSLVEYRQLKMFILYYIEIGKYI